MKFRLPAALILAALLGSSLVDAADYHLGNLRIADAHARATVPGQTSGAAYITIENKGKTGDKLLAVASPRATSVEVHSMQMDGNVMRMREVGELELKPEARIAMQPGDGYHIMLIGLKEALKSGDRVPLTLRFEKAGKIEIEAIVDTN